MLFRSKILVELGAILVEIIAIRFPQIVYPYSLPRDSCSHCSPEAVVPSAHQNHGGGRKWVIRSKRQREKEKIEREMLSWPRTKDLFL